MKILAVGDIVGENGLKKLKEILPNLKQKEEIDFIITNGENVAGGMGITERNYKEILSCGTDVVTMGNHTWAKKDIFNFIDDERIMKHAKLIRDMDKLDIVYLLGYLKDFNTKATNDDISEEFVNSIKNHHSLLLS